MNRGSLANFLPGGRVFASIEIVYRGLKSCREKIAGISWSSSLAAAILLF
ncbi:MAG: hypothetical protein WCH39_19375 [Schlesneria sp.]